MKRKVGDEKTTELVRENAVMGSNFGLFDGDGSTVRVGDAVYVALI